MVNLPSALAIAATISTRAASISSWHTSGLRLSAWVANFSGLLSRPPYPPQFEVARSLPDVAPQNYGRLAAQWADMAVPLAGGNVEMSGRIMFGVDAWLGPEVVIFHSRLILRIPPRQRRLPRRLAPLFRRHFGGAGWTAFQSAQAANRNSMWILSRSHCVTSLVSHA